LFLSPSLKDIRNIRIQSLL